jgi:hypothetical protein
MMTIAYRLLCFSIHSQYYSAVIEIKITRNTVNKNHHNNLAIFQNRVLSSAALIQLQHNTLFIFLASLCKTRYFNIIYLISN